MTTAAVATPRVENGVRYEPMVEAFSKLFNHPLFEKKKYILCTGGKGSGKLVREDMRVVTPFGMVPMKDIRLGDWVSSVDGGRTQVIWKSDRQYVDLYKLTFADGRSCIACKDHLWNYLVTGKTYKNGKRWKVATTQQLVDLMERKNDNTYKKNIYIPICEPVQFQAGVNRKIDPYMLGLILGNGSITQTQAYITHGDDEIKDYLISHHDCEVITYRNGAWYIRINNIMPILKELGLKGKHSYEKFIPEIYKFLDVEGRFELLRGLMDTDGTCDKGGHPSYCTTSKQLADDVAWIVRSLGGKCTTCVKDEPTYNHNGEKKIGRIAYTLYIRFKDISTPIFKLKRKQERMTEWNGGLGDMHLQITSIEPVDRGWGYCIQVNDPSSLFMVEDFIVTHNSFAICQHLCHKMLSETGKSFLITRKDMTDLRRTVFLRGNPSIVRTLDEWGYKGKYYLNKNEGYISINGNDVFFTGVSDPDDLRSMNLNYAWMEEVTDFNWEDFIEIDNRTRAKNEAGKKNHIYMSSNPSKSWHWSVQHFYTNPLEKYQDNSMFQISTPLNNPFLSDESIKDLLRQSYYDKNLFRVNVLGLPGQPEGLVYTHIEQLPEELWDKAIWKVQPVYGLDFGVNHAMVICECRKWKGAWYVRQRFFAKDQLNYDLLKHVLDTNVKWKEHVKPLRSLYDNDTEYAEAMELWEHAKFIPNIDDYKEYGFDSPKDLIPFNYDPTAKYWCDHQPDFYQPFIRAGFGYVRKANKDNVLAGIMTVKKYRVIISSSSTDGLRQMNTYAWKKKQGDVTQRDEPEKVEDDFCDSLRYALHSEETYKSVGGGFLGSTGSTPAPKQSTPQLRSKSNAVYIPNSRRYNDGYDY